MDAIKPRLLNREAHQLIDACFWSGSQYWTTRQPGTKRDRTKNVIKIAHLAKAGWIAFIFSKFHPGGIEIFRSLPEGERWFYTEPINKFLSFSAWCCPVNHFEFVLSQLRSLPSIECELVIPQTRKGLSVPTPFTEMGLEFFEVGSPC